MQAKTSPLIHIGYPKTATTWFQHDFFPYVSNYRLVPREHIKEHVIRPNPFTFGAERSRNALTKEFGEALILSEELLLGSVRSGGFNLMHSEQMALRLQRMFPAAEIVMFIRNQPDMIASAYGQYIRDGGREKIEVYLNKARQAQMIRLRSFCREFLDYSLMISFYQKLFPGKVTVYLHEEFATDPQAFADQFSKKFNLMTNTSALSYKPRNLRIRNLELRRLGNRLYRFRYLSPRRLSFGLIDPQKLFAHKQTTRNILGTSYDEIVEFYKPCNRKLLEQFGMEEIRKYNYPL